MKEMADKGRSFLLQKSYPAEKRMTHRNLADREFHPIYHDHPSDFVQLKHEALVQVDSELDMPCFDQFNPDEKGMYDETIANWSKAYLEVANRVNEKEQVP
jgi:hypothetical protein